MGKVQKLPSGFAPAGAPQLPGIITDTRIIDVAELADLYRSAHAFVPPSCGEGWCIPLVDAMATGLQCIWTATTAVLDYADETIGYPPDFEMIPLWQSKGRFEVDDNRPPDYNGSAAAEDSIVRA